MRAFSVILVTLVLAAASYAQKAVTFPTVDGGVVSADSYGAGEHGVVLAHGGRFNKGSWEKQAQALEAAGYRVLAIDFRGYGRSRGPGDSDPMSSPLHLDVLAAVRHLRKGGAKTVAVVGAPKNSKHLHCLLWRATTRVRAGCGSQEFARSTRRRLNRKS